MTKPHLDFWQSIKQARREIAQWPKWKQEIQVSKERSVEVSEKWEVKQNRHPNCDGSPWGWIEGIDQRKFNITWSGRKEEQKMELVCNAHNESLETLRAKVETLEGNLSRSNEIALEALDGWKIYADMQGITIDRIAALRKEIQGE